MPNSLFYPPLPPRWREGRKAIESLTGRATDDGERTVGYFFPCSVAAKHVFMAKRSVPLCAIILNLYLNFGSNAITMAPQAFGFVGILIGSVVEYRLSAPPDIVFDLSM